MIHWVYIVGLIVMYVASARFMRLMLVGEERRSIWRNLLCFLPIINTLLIAIGFLYFLYILVKEIWLERNKLNENKD